MGGKAFGAGRELEAEVGALPGVGKPQTQASHTASCVKLLVDTVKIRMGTWWWTRRPRK